MKKPVSMIARIMKNVSVSAAALVISSFGLVAVAAMGGVDSSLVSSGSSPFLSFLNGDQSPDQLVEEVGDVETIDIEEPTELDDQEVDAEDQTEDAEDLDNQDEDLDEQDEDLDEQDEDLDEQDEDLDEQDEDLDEQDESVDEEIED